MLRDRKGMHQEEAETLALQALAFLAEEPPRLVRFCRLTGMEPAELGAAASEGTMQAAILEHLLSDESLLLVFAGTAGVAPEAVATAHRLLSGSRDA